MIVRDVDFASTSETSLLPFYGRCHLGYLPSHGVVLGLSKVARLVAMLAKRLQTQERFTQELINTFEAEVLPQVRLAVAPYDCINALKTGEMRRIVILRRRHMHCAGLCCHCGGQPTRVWQESPCKYKQRSVRVLPAVRSDGGGTLPYLLMTACWPYSY